MQAPRTWIKNIVVAAALGLAAVATWAVTGSPEPSIEASVSASQEG